MQPRYNLIRSEQIYDDGKITIVSYDTKDECENRLVITNHTDYTIIIHYNCPKEEDNYDPIRIQANAQVKLLYGEQALDWEKAFGHQWVCFTSPDDKRKRGRFYIEQVDEDGYKYVQVTYVDKDGNECMVSLDVLKDTDEARAIIYKVDSDEPDETIVLN